MSSILHSVWLACKYSAGSNMPKRLLEAFGSAENVYHADKTDYINEGFRVNEISAVMGKSMSYAAKICEFCTNKSIRIISYGDEDYPAGLYDIPTSPCVLFCKGTLPRSDTSIFLTLVGTRAMSKDGALAARRMAFQAAAGGAVVVSGFARGIDSICHKGAIDAGGKTVAVLGCGIDVVYPPENALLFDEITANGAVITEFLPGEEPKASNFPIRNRLMSAISHAVTVIEAPIGSGALITVNHAFEQKKKVFSVPGSPVDPASEGNNSLIKEGVTAVVDGYDLLGEFEFMYPDRISVNRVSKVKYFIPPQLLTKEQRYFEYGRNNGKFGGIPVNVSRADELQGDQREFYERILRSGPVTADEFVTKTRTLGDVLIGLAELEIAGYLSAVPGGLYTINEETSVKTDEKGD